MTGVGVAVAGLAPIVDLESTEELGLDDLLTSAPADASSVVEDQLPWCCPDMFKERPQPVADTPLNLVVAFIGN